MKKVLIFGATGMLGNALYAELKDKYDLVLALRNKGKITLLEKKYGSVDKRHKVVEFEAGRLYDDFIQKKGSPSPYLDSFLKETGEIDYAINAIGITIPYSIENQTMTFFINGALPHILANTFKEKLIHITTDCVYNGKNGFPYDEDSPKTPVDLYGLSKSLGEPENCLTLRTSIIGRELEGFTGLLEWFLQQKGKTLTGFANHFWNGLTTKEFARTCDKIFKNRENFPKSGIFHIFSNSVSKYEMLQIFEKKYKIGVVINSDSEQKLNRTLSTKYELNSKLKIPSFEKMVEKL